MKNGNSLAIIISVTAAIVAFFTVTAVIVAFFTVEGSQTVTGWTNAYKAGQAYEAIEDKSLDELVSDEAARIFYRNLFTGLRDPEIAFAVAKEVVFEENFCEVVFPTKATNNKTFCRRLMDSTELTVSNRVLSIASKTQRLIGKKAYATLHDPKGFINLYFKKRDIFIEEYHRQSKDERQQTIEQINKIAVVAVNYIINKKAEIQEEYNTYLTMGFHNQSAPHGKHSTEQFVESWRAYERLGTMIMEGMRDFSHDSIYYANLYEYLCRRYNEGGDELLFHLYIISHDFSDNV